MQGTRDEPATWDLIESVCTSLPLAEPVKIQGADHAFKAGKQNTIQVLTDKIKEWIEKLLRSKKVQRNRALLHYKFKAV